DFRLIGRATSDFRLQTSDFPKEADMRRTLLALLVAAIGIVSWPVTAVFAQANSNKTRGTVSALGADSVTVKVRDAEMKFSVTPRTIVEARGAGTRDRQAQAAG